MESASNNKADLNKSQIEQQMKASEPNTFQSSNQSKLNSFQYQTCQNNFKNELIDNSYASQLNQLSQKNECSNLSFKIENKVEQVFSQQNKLLLQNSQKKQTIMFEILQKIFSQRKINCFRLFCNNLTSWFIQSLKEENRKIRDTKFLQQKKIKELNWPFKDLYYKANKSQDEHILLQFVNMCAQKIQATFKAYITKKRHIAAQKKVKIFKQKFGAVLKGWKSWNVFNCKKIKQIRNNIINLQKQEEHQILHSNLQKQLKLKKLTYLRSNIQNNVKLFKDRFFEIYNNGTWIFQVQKCFKPYKRKGPHHLEHSYYPNEIQNHQILKKQNTIKPNKRQFISKEPVQQKQIKIYSKANNIQQKPKQSKVSQLNTVPLDERPICTKGSYKIDQENLLNSQNQFLKVKENIAQKNQAKEEIKENQNQQTFQSKKRIQERKKMEKRHKYDPRKAIEQAKKKKKEQKEHLQSCSQEIKQKNNNNEQKNVCEEKQQNSRSKSRQKTVQKLPKKQKQFNKKDDNSKSVKSIVLNKNANITTKSPHKVTPKIDCWGGGQTSTIIKKQQKIKIKAIVQKNQQNSYKSKYLNKILKKNKEAVTTEENEEYQENANQYKLNYQRMKLRQNKQKQSTYEEQISDNCRQSVQNQRIEKYAKLIKQKNLIEKDSKIQQPQPIIGRFSNNNYSNLIKQQKEVQNMQMLSKKQKYDYLNHNMKQIIEKKQTSNFAQTKLQKKIQKHQQFHPVQKNNNVVMRPIEQLQKVYETQYFQRFSNLRPKLQMLYGTRQSQIRQMIPVISEQGKFIKRIMKEHSNMFWQQAKKLDSNFIQFIGRA